MAYLVNISILVAEGSESEAYDSLNALLNQSDDDGVSNIIDYQVSQAEGVHTALEDSISNNTYEEGDAFKHWVIFSQSEADASDGEAGYWSNELGWCSLELATNFDAQAVNLPITTNNDATMMMRPSLFQQDV